MDDAMDKTRAGLNSSCIWCLSNYSPVADSNGDNNKQLELYRKKRYKLVLEYLLQNDTVHYTTDQPNEDQHRRHVLLQKLLELRDTEMAVIEGALYQLCPACSGKADEVMRLHLALEVIQMKLVDKISCLTEAVITNSMYGSNEVTKKRMQELEIWLQQQEQGTETEGTIGEVERLKNYMGTLEQFQTLIFEGGSKPRSVPCVYLQKCMPISSFSAEEKVAIDCGFANMHTTKDFININIPPQGWPTSSFQSPSLSSRPPPQTRVKRAKLSKTEAKVNTSSKRSTSRKTPKAKPRNTRKGIPKQTKIATLEHSLQKEKINAPPTSYETSMELHPIVMEDGLESEIKEEPTDEDLPLSPVNPDGFQFQEDPDQFLSHVDHEQAITTTAEVKVEHEDSEQQGLGKRRRLKPVRFCPPNFHEPVCLPKPRQKTGITKEQHKLVKGAPRHILNILKPKRSKLTEKQKKRNRNKKLPEFRCSSCDFVAVSSYTFIHHLRGHETDEKIFECKEADCEERHFSEKQFYDFHIKLHKTSFGINSKCGICSMIVPPPKLTTHMKSHEGTAVFPCSHCYFCTDKLKDYLYHLKHHVRAKFNTLSLPKFVCPLCPKLFLKRRDVISEMTTHLYNDHGCNELLLKCEFKGCPESFLFKIALKNHYNIHLKRFKCDRCKYAFVSNGALRDHVQTVHLKLKLFMCNVGDCLENFKRQAQLGAHQVKCHDFPKLQCELCPLEFTNTDARRNHMRRTHNDKSYVCVTCGKECPTVENLKLHETIHFEKTVACDQCDFVTKSKHHLKRHKTTQHRTGPMKYGCPHCPKRFNYKSAMEDHTRTHTGERPHQCHICSVAFAKKQPLDNHIRKVHSNQEKKDDPGTGTVAKNPTHVVIPVAVANNASGSSTVSFVAL